ncbi:cell division protein FtsQ/DivIB [Apilactobacillus xinyiensis]|uniref:cell division protein FtsQ/DivIB n=1 Tax=Apilactobacillus xinyiensis TaxID=2841032 RepID=UPI00200DA0E1|nr:FtsQ-type POTRA domain-containing protein [Apilactobacillus xinyiensis]MCL0329892.1 FtsQ-type POTRA domain-containing protein [Apilactobacillus xinyiensis]
MNLKNFSLDKVFKFRHKNNSKKVVTLNRSKIKIMLKKFFIVFIPLFIILLISLYFISPLSKISSIKIIGNENISNQYIKNKSGIHLGDSIFKIIGKNKMLNSKLTDDNLQIKDANFKLFGSNKLKIYIKQYQTIGYNSDKNNRAYPILASGKELNTPIDNPNTDKLPYLVNFKNDNQRKYIVKEMNKLPSYIRNNIRVISFYPTDIFPDGLHIYMRDGHKVYVLISNFKNKMPYYHSIASKLKVKSIINLEVGAYSYPHNSK